MAKDIQDRVGQILGNDSARALAGTAVTEALKALGSQRSSNGDGGDHRSRGALSGMRGLAAGAGAAAVAPMAAKGIGKLIKGNGGAPDLGGAPKKLAQGAASKLGDKVGDKVTGKIDEAGGPSGILKDTIKSALPFGGGGGGGGGKQDAEGVGKGRRMPIQQSLDISLPIETVYNQWTQFEDWPKFMHRVTRVSQDDPCKVKFTVKIWGKSKEFTAEIETQRPDDRIKWKTSDGMNLAGVVAFRELGPNLTRVILSFDVDPGGLLEKYARGARYVKRAARADLHRFGAFIEMLEHETGAWRGVIEEGELVEDHNPSYDKKREYGDADELVHGRGSDEDEDDDDEDSEDEETSGRNGGEPRRRRSSSGRSSSQSSRSRQSSGSSRAQSRSGGSSRSTSRSGSSGRSSSGRSSSGRSSSAKSSGGRSSSGRSSSGRSASAKSSSGPSSRAKSSSGRSSSGSSRSSGSTRSSSSSGSKSSGRTRSRSSSGSSSSHQGRQRSRSSRRS